MKPRPEFSSVLTRLAVGAGLLTLIPALLVQSSYASPAVLTGQVTNRNTHSAIVGATVYVFGTSIASVNTDGSGNYQFTGDQYFGASGTLYVQASGYWGAAVSFTIISPLPNTVNVTLLPGGTVLMGTIKDSSNTNGIPGAIATFSSANAFFIGGQGKSVTADGTGHYAFDSSLFMESAAAGTSVKLRATATFVTDFVADPATDILTARNHGRSNGAAVKVFSNGTLPAPLAAGTTYYVRDATTNTLKLAATNGGAAIDITTAGTGTHTLVNATSYVSPPEASVILPGPIPVTQDVSLLPGAGTVLAGKVTDGSNNPISGATVFIVAGFKKTTDGSGNYSVDISEYSASTGTLSVQANGFWAKATPFTIAAVPTTVNATLATGGPVLQGTIRDTMSNPSGMPTVNYKPCSTCGGDMISASANIMVTGDNNGLYSFDSSFFLESAKNGGSTTFTVDPATDILTAKGHNQVNGAPVKVSSTGTLPAPLMAATTYFV